MYVQKLRCHRQRWFLGPRFFSGRGYLKFWTRTFK